MVKYENIPSSLTSLHTENKEYSIIDDNLNYDILKYPLIYLLWRLTISAVDIVQPAQ